MENEAIGVPKPGKKYAQKRPTRDEFELEELGNQLSEAKAEDSEILLTVWGMDEPVRGRITEMDSRTGKIHVQRHGETTKVPFMNIMKVESPGSIFHPQIAHNGGNFRLFLKVLRRAITGIEKRPEALIHKG